MIDCGPSLLEVAFIKLLAVICSFSFPYSLYYVWRVDNPYLLFIVFAFFTFIFIWIFGMFEPDKDGGILLFLPLPICIIIASSITFPFSAFVVAALIVLQFILLIVFRDKIF